MIKSLFQKNKILKNKIRQRVLLFVGGLIVLSLFVSTLSLVQISSVNKNLEEINRIAIPLGKSLNRLQIHSEGLKRELNQGLSSIHWSQHQWKPRFASEQIWNQMDLELKQLEKELNGTSSFSGWEVWEKKLREEFHQLKSLSQSLYSFLNEKNQDQAVEIYPQWSLLLSQWLDRLQEGVTQYDQSFKESFSQAQSHASHLRTGLEVILLVVVGLSFMLLWLGERALKPLSELTHLAREITKRGLKKEDKGMLIEIPVGKNDEVSALTREFHAMASQLLEREKVVEDQKESLEEQYRLLKTMGRLNETILNSIRSILIVVDLTGRITQANPVAIRWLKTTKDLLLGSALSDWSELQTILAETPSLFSLTEKKINHKTVHGKTYGGQVFPLMGLYPSEVDQKKNNQGVIIVLEDLTDELEMEERLRQVENLASVGRLSAQVAHEVRNPLHAIGLEAEIALDQVLLFEKEKKKGTGELKQSLQSILVLVDRMESITENYLKLSKMSSGSKELVDLSQVLQNVLAAYSSLCEKFNIQMDWKIESPFPLRVWGDAPLLEQALGNLLQNAIQSIEQGQKQEGSQGSQIHFKLGHLESGRAYLEVQDDGPGVPEEIVSKIFTPFVTTKAQGTGLGLSFVKKVVEDHGGEINYLPSLKGARFQILIPLSEEEAQSGISLVEEMIHPTTQKGGELG